MEIQQGPTSDTGMTVSSLLQYCSTALDQIHTQISKLNKTFYGETAIKELHLDECMDLRKVAVFDLNKGIKNILVDFAERLAETKEALEALNTELI